MPLVPLSHRWEEVTKDIITNLPEPTASWYTGFLVMGDPLSKMAIYLPFRKDINSPELARMFFEYVICNRNLSDMILTNCETEFTSRF